MRIDRSTMWRQLLTVVVAILAVVSAGPSLLAQRPLHYFYSANLPPGTVGQGQVQRFLPLRGYYQPIELIAPKGARVSVYVDGKFSDPRPERVVAGMQVGHVYQLKISSIPNNEDFEIFPTIEVINRLYPPEGKAQRFPVPIQFTQEELELAISGRFVTRVVYLEDQANALPIQEDPARQRYFEAAPGQDPLRVADEFGRPMLIMRMGSRVPDLNELASGMASSSPPAIVYPPQQATPVLPNQPEQAIERQGFDIPRVESRPIGRPYRIPFVTPQEQR